MHQDDTSWNGRERRAVDAAAFQLMAETRQKVVDQERTMMDKISDLKDDLDAHMVKSELRHVELTKAMDELKHSTLTAVQGINQIATETHKLFKASIPNGDADGHRKAHEYYIEKDKKDEEFRQFIKKTITGVILTAVTSWVGLALWQAFLAGPVR